MLDIRDHGGTFGGFGGKNIKSIQRGSVSPFGDGAGKSHDITISSVDTSKSIVRLTYFPNGTSPATATVRISLVNSTKINLARFMDNYIYSGVLYWEVIEFNNVKSKQIGSTSGSGGSPKTISISPVDLNKSLVFYSQYSTSTNAAGVFARDSDSGLGLINNNTLELTGQSSSYIFWQVIEFN